jgi:hypothetical protein
MSNDDYFFGGPHFSSGMFGPNGQLVRLHKGGGAPGPTEQDKILKEKQITLLNQQIADAKKGIEFPSFSLPKAQKPAPLPNTTNQDTEFAATEAKRRAAGRTNSGRGTLLAGETGGYKRMGGSLLGAAGGLA